MRIIDRYLLRQFLSTFFICFLSLTGLYVVFDAFTKMEAFMGCARGRQMLKLIAGYYVFQPLLFFDRTAGLLALMSAMFTVTWIQRHNEMTALMAAGISRIRIVAPVIIIAVAVDLLAVVNREVLIPRFRHEIVAAARRLGQRAGDLASGAGEDLCPQSDNRSDVLLRGKFAYLNQQRIEKPDFLLPLGLRDYGNRLLADNAYYTAPAAGRPGGYLLDGMQAPKNLAKQPSLLLRGKAVVITPRDAPDWLGPKQCFFVSDVPFEQLVLAGQASRRPRLHCATDLDLAQQQLRLRRRRPRGHPYPHRATGAGHYALVPRSAAGRVAEQPQRLHGHRLVPGRGHVLRRGGDRDPAAWDDRIDQPRDGRLVAAVDIHSRRGRHGRADVGAVTFAPRSLP